MHEAEFAAQLDPNAGLLEPLGVGLALVTQHVMLVGDDQRSRQAAQVLRVQGADAGI